MLRGPLLVAGLFVILGEQLVRGAVLGIEFERAFQPDHACLLLSATQQDRPDLVVQTYITRLRVHLLARDLHESFDVRFDLFEFRQQLLSLLLVTPKIETQVEGVDGLAIVGVRLDCEAQPLLGFPRVPLLNVELSAQDQALSVLWMFREQLFEQRSRFSRLTQILLALCQTQENPWVIRAALGHALEESGGIPSPAGLVEDIGQRKSGRVQFGIKLKRPPIVLL